jgi:CRP/FNR family transcriptional regulator
MTHTLRSPHLQALFSKGRVKKYIKGEVVCSTDDTQSLVLVKSGYIKRYKIATDGTLGIQIMYGPEDIFSLTHMYRLLLGQTIYEGLEVFYYESMGDCEVLHIKPEAMVEAIKTEPALHLELFAEAGRHLKSCVHSIENISLDSAHIRVAHQILFLAQTFGIPETDGTVIQIPLTHQDLADLLSLTRETVTRAITELRHKKLLAEGRRLIVKDIDRLKQEAYP